MQRNREIIYGERGGLASVSTKMAAFFWTVPPPPLYYVRFNKVCGYAIAQACNPIGAPSRTNVACNIVAMLSMQRRHATCCP